MGPWQLPITAKYVSPRPTNPNTKTSLKISASLFGGAVVAAASCLSQAKEPSPNTKLYQHPLAVVLASTAELSNHNQIKTTDLGGVQL